MGFLKRFFSDAVEQVQAVDTAIATCQFESSNKDCSLIQTLKEKQAAKREVDDKIKSYDQHSTDNIAKFLELLVKMENHGFRMSDYDYCPSYCCGDRKRSFITESFERAYGVIKLEEILDMMPEASVAAIGEELNAMKKRAAILGDLRRQANELNKEIMAIKAQLGIE